MVERGKRIAMEGDGLDRISTIPSDVITQVLDLLPIKDLVRTSILSRKWRYVWASHPNIKIYPYTLVIKKRKKGDTSVLHDLTNIMNKIIVQHVGPILKFSLEFPWFTSTNDFDFAFVDNWLLYLSRNGIQKLTLKCLYRKPYILPSHVFSASELVSLRLSTCIFNPPNGKAHFSKLRSLKFFYIDFDSSKVTSVLHTPQLTFLRFINCFKVCHVKIRAPKLETLVLNWNKDVDLIGLEMSKLTTTAVIKGGTYKEITLTKLFEKWPLLSCFYVHGSSFKYLVADIQPEKLPVMTSPIRHLVLGEIDWADSHQMSSILYLLRSSTTLSRLEISAITPRRNATTDVSNLLDAAQSINWTIDSLEIVIIDKTFGSEEEMRFIKILLSCSPRLKKMFVQRKMRFQLATKERMLYDDDNANFKLSKHLMRFPRASKEAEIISKSNVKKFQTFYL